MDNQKGKDTLELGGELRLSNAMDDGEGVLPLSEVLKLLFSVYWKGGREIPPDVTSRLEYLFRALHQHL